ncbi:MAG: flagellar hook-associated protein FlgK [Ignavibacteriales bacterium]
MRSTFMAFDIARKSIMAQQSALDVTGHNIANASTEGYTRQSPILKTTSPFAAPSMMNVSTGQFGTGVVMEEITRLRDGFVDLQMRDENQTLGYWESMQTALDKIEVVLNEPTDEGLRGVLDEFWTAWQSLSESPESESVRAMVLERGQEVVDAFNHCYNQLTDLEEDLNYSVKAKVEEINSLGAQIADLNYQIQTITISGMTPNDLYDSRDLLLDQLSQIVEIQINDDRNGMVSVLIGGAPLVQANDNNVLGLNTDSNGLYKVVWDSDPSTHPGSVITNRPTTAGDFEISATSGALIGLLDARGAAEDSTLGSARGTVPDVINMLNDMAKTVIMTTNAIHRGGYSLNNTGGAYPDGTNFFNQDEVNENDPSISWAKIMSLDSSIKSDVKNIAAATHRTWDGSGNKINFGDGSNALLMAQLKQQLTGDDYWTQSDALTETFPSTLNWSFTVNYNGTPTTISKADPTVQYDDMQELVDAINTQFESQNIDTVSARAEGNTLVFYSNSNLFTGVTANTFPVTNFTAVASRDLIEDSTVDDYWRANVSSIGVVSQEATRMVTNQETLISQLETKRQSVSGVSLDEEMTNMIQFQHAYQAAARYMNVIDEAIDVIVNKMGLVGR